MCKIHNEDEKGETFRERGELVVSPVENGWVVSEDNVLGKQFCFNSQSSLGEFIRDYYA